MLSKDLTVSYYIYNSVSRDLVFIYDLSVVENDFAFTYTILTSATKNFIIRYDIDIGKSLSFIYNLNLRNSLSIKYDINIRTNLSFDWIILKASDLVFSYGIEQYASQSPTTQGIRDGAIVTSRNNLVSVYTQDIYIMKQIRPLNVADWEDPVIVTKGSHPSLTDQLGTLWLVWEYNNYIYMSSSLDGGRTFSDPIILKT